MSFAGVDGVSLSGVDGVSLTGDVRFGVDPFLSTSGATLKGEVDCTPWKLKQTKLLQKETMGYWQLMPALLKNSISNGEREI